MTLDSYEPLSLWLIPVLFRTRAQYYDDAERETEKLIDFYWSTSKSLYASRGEFEKSKLVEDTWKREAPPWWGLNDIVAWIDIRMCLREREFQVSLFLPTRRVTRRLKDKVYCCSRQERVPLRQRSTNDKLRSGHIRAVTVIASDPSLERVSWTWPSGTAWCAAQICSG